MLQLFFQHANGDFEPICEVKSVDIAYRVAMDDLKTRAPHFKSFYQRIWEDENGWHWMDVGDHSCFYVVKGDWQ